MKTKHNVRSFIDVYQKGREKRREQYERAISDSMSELERRSWKAFRLEAKNYQQN